MKKNSLKEKAFYWRRKGYSLKEISEKLNISKSTASLWLRGAKISQNGRRRLHSLREKGLERSIVTKKKKNERYLSDIDKNCSVLKNVDTLSVDQCKLLLAFLFWTEGSSRERRLVFSNSDPEMIKSYLYLLRKCYNLNEKNIRAVLHLHEYHNGEEQIDFWSKITGIDNNQISIYNKANTAKRKRRGYQGCLQIRYGDVRILDELDIIVKRFINFIDAGVG